MSAGSRIGPYEVVSLLGAGGMGEVYRARDARLQRDVALKILPPVFAADSERVARFEREAQVLASLNHPNIAAIYGFEQGPADAGRHVQALVLELVEGPTLADRIAQGPIPIDEALAIAKQIAEALEAAHEHGIVHRDLKPANIKLRDDGTVKVLDFGLARALGPAEAGSQVPSGLSMSPTVVSPAMTQLGVILGTAAYMSPEQARGKAADRRADIWAFGCVLYEMLTGRAPFADEDVSLTLSKVLQRDVDWNVLPASAQGVAPLLRRCLDKDPRTRLRDIGEARVAIASWPAASVDQTPSGPRSRGVPYAAAIAALIVTAAVAAAAAWGLRPTPTDAKTPVVRLAVTLPAGERLAGAQGFGGNAWMPLAISPDGAQLAYVSGGRLFIRPMNSLEVRSTQGTEGAASPFFSPDGQWIGFFAQGQLKKVSVTGGLATPLTEAPIAAGASWADDGFIYYVPTNIAGIWKIPANGGKAEAVTTLDRTKGEVSHRWPQMLPGGRAILFTTWRGPGWDEMDVQVHDVATGQRRVLIQGGSTGRYVRSGHLVYVRAGELMAAPFDLTGLALGGEPRSLGIPVREDEGGYFAASDTGLLAYVPAGARDRRLVFVSRDGRIDDLAAPLRPYEDVVLSPDGRRLALTVSGASWGIWVFDLAAKREILLTRDAATSQWPVWTHDGSRIIYRGTRAGFRNLYWRRADGTGDEERLTTNESMQTPISVSPDGQWLAYEEITSATGNDAYLLPLKGTRTPKPLMQTPASEDEAQFSPDGRWLAFQSDESGRMQVYIQPFPGPGERVPVSTGTGILPRWSADGRTLFYLDGETVMQAEITTVPAVRVTAPRPAFTLVNMLGEYAVTRDGRLLGIQRTGAAEAATQIHVVVNWFEELAQRVPQK